MILLLLACTGESVVTDPYLADVAFTLDKAELGVETVDLTFGGWSDLGDGWLVLTALDGDDLHELIVVVADFQGAGVYVPDLVRYRKGQQLGMDTEGRCSLEIRDGNDPDLAWDANFECTGITSDDTPDGEPWVLTEGSWSGGAWTEQDDRAAWLSTDAFRYRPLLQPEEGDPVDATDTQRTLVVPWQGERWWVLMGTDQPTEVVVRFDAQIDGLQVSKRTRAAPVVAGLSVLIESDTEINVALDDQDVSGTELELLVWDDLLADPDTKTLRVY